MTRILIIGATGQQGGAVINELLAAKVPSLSLRALTRNTTSPAATRLTSRGIEVVQGSLEDHASLVSALQGVDSAFLAIADGPKERKQGLSFLKAAEEVNLPYLVYSSAPEVANADGIAILEDKLVIEATLRKTSIEHTVLHPWFFYEIFPVEPGFKRWLTLGASDYLLQGKSLVTTAVADIGWFGAQALLHQKRYTGRVIPILGDNLTMSEAQTAIARVSGRSVWMAPHWLARILMRLVITEDDIQLMEFIRTVEHDADLQAVRDEKPDVLTFEGWLRRKAQ